ncbi:MAG: zinc ABC transporter substrate-binding protein [Deltaproteobacteria bacterium]|jgi:zinc/manganese transport system substrate-binding protein|nr:zinc ABC transporter substrate-binding protein [Deltaproteobacteria bacterium]MBW2531617.1 zinc ABC transporter substrate-binding protein [Deltaproteobacteria bacterium]
MFPTKFWTSTLALFALWLVPQLARAELEVVATVPTLASVAKAVGGTKVNVQSMALHTQDPHFVDAKPSLALELNKADLLLAVGLDLEAGWLPVLQTGARNGDIQVGSKGYLDCSQFIRKMEVPTVVDRSHGDIHPGGNPHYLYDPRAVSRVAKGIAKRMAELDPDNARFYQAKVTRFLKRLRAKAKKLQARLAPYRGQPVIGYHKSWAYLADWLGLEQVQFIEPKPGIPPNPAHVAKVLATARKKDVPVIIQEGFYPDSTTKLIANKSGARLVVVPGGVNFQGGESYLDHLDRLAALLQRGLAR